MYFLESSQDDHMPLLIKAYILSSASKSQKLSTTVACQLKVNCSNASLACSKCIIKHFSINFNTILHQEGLTELEENYLHSRTPSSEMPD